MWVLEFELRSPGLYLRCLYTKGHWTKSLFFLSKCVITKGKLCFWLCSILILTLFSLKTKSIGGGTKVVVCSEYDQSILYTYIKIPKWNTLFCIINNANLKGNNTVYFWILRFQNTVIYYSFWDKVSLWCTVWCSNFTSSLRALGWQVRATTLDLHRLLV